MREKCSKVEQYRIELAQREHVAELPAIERAAAALFPETMLPENIRDSALPLEQLAEAQARQHLWVALTSNGQPVGFAMALIIKEAALLVEVDVHPHHQRRGLGRALVQAVIECAQRARLARVVLTTFRDLPWNAPFYESMGFCRLTPVEVTDDLAHWLDQEQRSGLQGRVAMQLVFPLPNDHPASRTGIET